jgi:hypothetical protein
MGATLTIYRTILILEVLSDGDTVPGTLTDIAKAVSSGKCSVVEVRRHTKALTKEQAHQEGMHHFINRLEEDEL